MYILDSSIIIAGFRQTEPQHEKASQRFRNDIDVILLDRVLEEVVTVLKMREDIQFASQVQEFLLNAEHIHFTYTSTDEFVETLTYTWKYEHRHLSFVDTLISVVAKRRWIQARTYDKSLEEILKWR